MPDYSIQVGNVELVSLSDGFPQRSPLIPFPDTTIEQWREFPELLDEHDQVRSRYGTVAVRSSGKLIIVDTGLQAEDGTLLKDMEEKGIDREAVDLVVFTHLHPDHVGWNLTNGRAQFPQRPVPGAAEGLGLLDSTQRRGWGRAHHQPGHPVAGPEHHGPDRRRVQHHRRTDHCAHAGTYPRPRFHHHRVGRRAGLHPWRRSPQRGPSSLHRLVPHFRYRARRVTADPAHGSGHAGSRGNHRSGGPLPRPWIRPLRPWRKPPCVAGNLTGRPIPLGEGLSQAISASTLDQGCPAGRRPTG